MIEWHRYADGLEKERRREERAALKRQKDLERQAREQAKLNEHQQAVLIVQAYETRVEVLLSLHREVGKAWNWNEFACALPPCPPANTNAQLYRVQRQRFILQDRPLDSWQASFETAKSEDRFGLNVREQDYAKDRLSWQKFSALARRILAGDLGAYLDAVQEFSPLAEMTELGSQMDFVMHSARDIECVLSMKDVSVIPTDVKSFTSSGKLSVKAMPRAQFHEIYQDYICGGILRVARESFALLPIHRILVTALVQVEGVGETPVMSVIVERDAILRVNFETADASDTVAMLRHRGDFKASRKSGAFLPITAFNAREVFATGTSGSDVRELLLRAVNLRNELRADRERMLKLAHSS